MTATTTTGIRISPQLWAEFGMWARARGKTRNSALVDMIRERVVADRATAHDADQAMQSMALPNGRPPNPYARYDTTTHSADRVGEKGE